MKFLITGASGWIGFSLINHLYKLYGKENIQLILSPKSRNKKESKRRKILIEKKFNIVINDLLEDDLDIKTIKPFDVLFHLAAFTEVEIKSPSVHVNDIGTERLLNNLRQLLPNKRVIYTGSILSIDRSYPDNTPMTENYPCRPRTIYGLTKLKGELIVKQFAKDIGFEWCILRLPTVYGPGRTGGFFGVIPEKLLNGSLATRLLWPGRISLVYIDDVIKALTFLGTKKYKCNETYHINSGENPSTDELIEEIAKSIGVKRKRISVPKFFWILVRYLVWFPGLLSILPFKLKITVLRISLLVIDGLVFDDSKFRAILPLKYTKIDKGLPAMYKEKIQ